MYTEHKVIKITPNVVICLNKIGEEIEILIRKAINTGKIIWNYCLINIKLLVKPKPFSSFRIKGLGLFRVKFNCQ